MDACGNHVHCFEESVELKTFNYQSIQQQPGPSIVFFKQRRSRYRKKDLADGKQRVSRPKHKLAMAREGEVIRRRMPDKPRPKSGMLLL